VRWRCRRWRSGWRRAGGVDPQVILALILAAVAAPEFAAVALDRDPARIVSSSFPDSVRPAAPEDEVVVPGPWRIASTVKGVRTWEAALPVRPRTLFFDRAPEGMEVRRVAGGAKEATKIAFGSGFDSWAGPNTWDFSTHGIRVRRRIDLGPPAPGEYAVVYPEATKRENLLDPARSGLAGAELAFRSFQVDDTTRHGIYLPAPAAITLRVDVPAGQPVLEMAPGLVPTEAGDPQLASEVRLTVSIADEDVWSERLAIGDFPRERLSLERWAGQSVELRFRTEAADGAVFPYAFVADPIVFEPMEDPPRAVIVFMDTVRRDHLPIYGYDRDTMPKLAAWSEDAAVFEDARTVAPWTLPSARTILTGAQPESYGDAASLARLFAEKGWITAAVVGNVYLSSNFQMAEDWTVHRCINWPPGGIQVDRALEIFDEAKDRPVFLELHFMDAHLPYGEPWRYRKLFAGARPKGLKSDSFLRSHVTHAKLGDDGKQYVRDRYDQALRYMDDQIARVTNRLGPDDLVVVLADHGEEFWDHGGFEHGHTLFDELLHVPLVVKHGGVPAGRYDAPTSLLDVAPTIAAWARLDAQSMTGLALGTLALDRGAFDDRPQAFGRPLYSERQWGVMKDGMKYVAKGYGEALRDLRADPREQIDLLRSGADTSPWLGAMAAALGQSVPRSWRLIPTSRGGLTSDLVAQLTVPGGIEAHWSADVPLGAGDVELASDATHLTVTWKAGKRGFRDVYVVPKEPIADATKTLSVAICSGKKKATLEKPDDPAWPPGPAHAGSALLTGRLNGITVSLGYGVAPEVNTETSGVKAFDAEMQGALEALGYVEGSESETAPPPPTLSDPCM
jgi:arylsulfatase A-like enzyme